jgi:hypothetical protein
VCAAAALPRGPTPFPSQHHTRNFRCSQIHCKKAPPVGFLNITGTTHPHPRQLTPGEAGTLQGVRRAVDAVQRCGVGGVRTGRQGRESDTTCKQPVNLAVKGAEESLSILPDYTPTVRPPPKRC